MPVCSQCGIENPDHTSFCLECGYAYSGETGKLNPDSILEGRYVIVKVLGRGGMGAVYQAVDQRLKNSLVAVKEMSATALGKDNHLSAVSAFEKEAAMLIGLRHPALPRISDFFSKHDRWYLVMDYIEGETLADVLKKRGVIPEPEVRDWGIQLCEILDYLHTRTPPVIFRDLKPSNIMITPDGRIKLIDFGIARHFRPGFTADTTAYGSSGYAPPEQYGDNQTDARSDIYALGAVLHHLLTGKDPTKNPFNFEPPGKTTAATPALEAVIMKALELKPADRPATVREVLALLRDDDSGSPVNKGGDVIAQAGGETAPFGTEITSNEGTQQGSPHMQAEAGGAMAICSNCGAELSRNANFCRNCGARAGNNSVSVSAAQEKQRNFNWVAAAMVLVLLLGAGAYGIYTWNNMGAGPAKPPQAKDKDKINTSASESELPSTHNKDDSRKKRKPQMREDVADGAQYARQGFKISDSKVPDFGVEFVQVRVPRRIAAGEDFKAFVVAKNTGKETWRDAGINSCSLEYCTTKLNDPGDTNESGTTVSMSNMAEITTNDSYMFDFGLALKNEFLRRGPGTYVLRIYLHRGHVFGQNRFGRETVLTVEAI